ncbi:MAG TPA: hypothetical protein VG147_09390 [Solirubrobacteraceae bacterium]|jgi:hypothetical protein|nr:hypothetical protein [Solirubrobacteraceae bacterium]
MSVVAMLAVGAFASASALAITPVYLVCLTKTGGKFKDRNCSETSGSGTFELVEVTSNLGVNGTLGTAGTLGVSKLKSTLLSAEILIICKKGKFTGEIGPKGLSTGTITYEACSAGNKKETFENCEVPNIGFNFVDQLVENSKGEIEDEFKPAAKGSALFVNIEIKNKEGKSCLQKGTFPVDGTRNAGTEPASTGARLLRILLFSETSKSNLTFNGEPATYIGEASIDLNNDDSWGACIIP